MGPRLRSCWLLAAAALALTLSAGAPAQAQVDADTLRQRYLIPLPPTVPVVSTVGRASPGSSAGSPSAFGANLGDGFVGAGFQAYTRASRIPRTGELGALGREDGAVVVGFGLGNSRDLVGVEVALTSFSTFRRGFFDRTGVSGKIHRVFPGAWGIALGLENAFVVGGDSDGGRSVYGAVSRVWGQGGFNPFQSVTTTVGLGSGRFRFQEDVEAGRDKRVNAFASVGFQVMRSTSLIADWTGQDLTLGASFVPLSFVPLIITPAVADITGQEGNKPRFTLGVGMGFKFAATGLVP